MSSALGDDRVGVPVRLSACYAAWCKAKQGKRPRANQLEFELQAEGSLQVAQAARWQIKRMQQLSPFFIFKEHML